MTVPSSGVEIVRVDALEVRQDDVSIEAVLVHRCGVLDDGVDEQIGFVARELLTAAGARLLEGHEPIIVASRSTGPIRSGEGCRLPG